MGILTRVLEMPLHIDLAAMAVRYWSGWACTYPVAEAEEQMSMSAPSGKKKGFCLSQHAASGSQELTAPLGSQCLWQHPSSASFWKISHTEVYATNWNMLVMQCKLSALRAPLRALGPVQLPVGSSFQGLGVNQAVWTKFWMCCGYTTNQEQQEDTISSQQVHHK